MDCFKSVTELLGCLRKNNIYIYGAGYVAELFWDALDRVGIQNRVKGVLVTSVNEKSLFHGLDVFSIDYFYPNHDDIICIAVHESLVDAIKAELRKREINKYIWITPFITDISLSSCFIQEICVETSALNNNIVDHLGIAIRYAAIDQFYQCNQQGYDLYKRGIAIFSNVETAESRLQWFISLIEDVDRVGYKQIPICVDQNHEIIDGEHRYALALYHHIDIITCRFYNCENYHKREVYLTEDVLRDHGFVQAEIDYLKAITTEIAKRGGIEKKHENNNIRARETA